MQRLYTSLSHVQEPAGERIEHTMATVDVLRASMYGCLQFAPAALKGLRLRLPRVHRSPELSGEKGPVGAIVHSLAQTVPSPVRSQT